MPRHHLDIWDTSENREDEDLGPHGVYIPIGEDRP